MLYSKVDTSLLFQPPIKELIQQHDTHKTAKRYYEFFSFTDNAIVFLKRYMTENFSFLTYFDQSSTSLAQASHNFYAAWPKLHKDPSPLVSILLLQLQNTQALASSLSPLDLKIEDEVREGFLKKISAIKEIQQSIDKKFQTLWKKSQANSTVYYQKLEEYKEEIDNVRSEYEDYESQTRHFKGYDITLVKELEEKLKGKLSRLARTKEAFDKVCNDSQDSYKAVVGFFDMNKGPIEEFLRLFLRILVEMTVFLVEKMQKNFVSLKQTTMEALQATKRMTPDGSWEAEDMFMKNLFSSNQQQVWQVKEINRINCHRQEFVNAIGFFSQETVHLCQEAMEKFAYFQDIESFKSFFSQFNPEIPANLLPFADLLGELKNSFFALFASEKISNEHAIQHLASERFKAYSRLTDNLSKALRQPAQDSRGEGAVKIAVSEFIKTEENLAKDYLKDLTRFYTVMNDEIWSKIIQACQKALGAFKDKIREDKLVSEAHRIQESLIQALGRTEHLDSLDKKAVAKVTASRDRAISTTEGDLSAMEERTDSSSTGLNKYNHTEFKFIKEKKAESLAAYVKKQTQEKLKEINPTPYKVEFETGDSTHDMSTHDDEAVLDSFACSLADKMLSQGRMYITAGKIVFKSYFNGRTLFEPIVLFIPLREIMHIAKKSNLLGFENMIEISTRKGSLLFTSFIFRDSAFSLLQKVMSTTQPVSVKSLNKIQSSGTPSEILDHNLEDLEPIHDVAVASSESGASKKPKKHHLFEVEFQKRNKEILKILPQLSKYDGVAYKYQYPLDLNTFFRVFLCKTPVSYDGKDYSCCWEIFEGIQNTIDLQVEDWTREIPKDVSKKRDLLGYRESLERNCKGVKKLDVPLPFVPKGFRFNQHNRLFFVNEKELVLFFTLSSPDKIPLSDTFTFHTCYILKDETGPDGKPQVSMSFNYYVTWHKSTMLKGIMSKAAKEDMKSTGIKIDKIINQLIKNGFFERKKQEIEAEIGEQESTEDDESDEGHVVEPEIIETQTEKKEHISEEEKAEVEKMEAKIEEVKKSSEFKISKNVLCAYFSISLILFSIVALRQFLG